VAWFLASYAREAKFRTDEGHLPALATIRTALEEALGMNSTPSVVSTSSAPPLFRPCFTECFGLGVME